jgi:Family of unknown function (DUF6335)
MAKRNPGKRARSEGAARKRRPADRLGKRPAAKKRLGRPQSKSKTRSGAKTAPPIVAKNAKKKKKKKMGRPKLDRARHALDDTVPTPPSSLDMVGRGSAARSGRAAMEENLREHRGMTSDITAGDVDVDVENAYFTGDETPGGDNPTPDQEVVDDIGKALGVEYQDAEELKGSRKVEERDRHRWELDPASAEDYKDRD